MSRTEKSVTALAAALGCTVEQAEQVAAIWRVGHGLTRLRALDIGLVNGEIITEGDHRARIASIPDDQWEARSKEWAIVNEWFSAPYEVSYPDYVADLDGHRRRISELRAVERAAEQARAKAAQDEIGERWRREIREREARRAARDAIGAQAPDWSKVTFRTLSPDEQAIFRALVSKRWLIDTAKAANDLLKAVLPGRRLAARQTTVASIRKTSRSLCEIRDGRGAREDESNERVYWTNAVRARIEREIRGAYLSCSFPESEARGAEHTVTVRVGDYVHASMERSNVIDSWTTRGTPMSSHTAVEATIHVRASWMRRVFFPFRNFGRNPVIELTGEHRGAPWREGGLVLDAVDSGRGPSHARLVVAIPMPGRGRKLAIVPVIVHYDLRAGRVAETPVLTVWERIRKAHDGQEPENMPEAPPPQEHRNAGARSTWDRLRQMRDAAR